jgi:TM2 domain-containing membrane protein YozV
MTSKFCLACGRGIDGRAEICPLCGVRQPMAYTAPPLGQNTASGKNRVAAGLFAILLGTFGVHKFYLGQIGQGILYLCLFWTGIPSIVGIVEGILYLTKSDAEFAAAYG